VAKTKITHNIAETRKTRLVESAGILLGEGAKSKVKHVSLSNDTVKPHIADVACDIISPLKISKLHLCLEYSLMSQLILPTSLN